MGSHGYRRLWPWESVFVDASVGLGIYGNIYAKELGQEVHEGRTRVEGAPYPPGRTSVLVVASWLLQLHLQVSRLSSSARNIIMKVLFRFESFWYSFSAKLKNREKQELALGSRLIG